MHELLIAESVVPETLPFGFELATAGTPLEGTRPEIQMRPGRVLTLTSAELV